MGKDWNTKVQKLLVNLKDTYTQKVAEEAELCKERTALNEELMQLGYMPSAAKLSVAGLMEGKINEKQAKILLVRNDFCVNHYAIRKCRAQLAEIDDRIRKTIDDAEQGKLKFAENDEEMIGELGKAADEKDLFKAPPPPPPKPVEKNQMQLGQDQQLAVSVKELELPGTLEAKLIAGGFGTIAKLAQALDDDKGEEHQKLIDNLTDTQYDRMAGAVRQYRKAHRDVKDKDPEPDREPANA